MSPTVTAAIIAASVGVLTLIGTLAAQYFGRRATSRDTQKALEEQREQLDRTLAEQRIRTLNERFATAAGQLGSDKPPAVRLAGVYAMAGLADDWPENRQTCVDVLCAYLRLPHDPNPGEEATPADRTAYRANWEVCHTVTRVITAHLKADAALSWQGMSFDFTGAVFDDGDFRGVRFSGGTVAFGHARFSGAVGFRGAQFSGGAVDFGGAEFAGGTVDFGGARFSGSTVDFGGALFSGGTVDFSAATVSGGEVRFRGARFSGSQVDFTGAEFSGGQVDFGSAEFSGGRVEFIGARFSGSQVDFSVARFSGSRVIFDGARFSGGQVDFGGATFSGSRVDFLDAHFCGSRVDLSDARFASGEVDFSSTGDWSFPPAFGWTGTPPRGVKLPTKEDQART
jgi:uncharacterized protein YjbI with pentapeptide repeats